MGYSKAMQTKQGIFLGINTEQGFHHLKSASHKTVLPLRKFPPEI